MKIRAVVVLSIVVGGSACGIPQEIHEQTLRDLDRCKTDLTRTQSDFTSTQKNADELATEASELRECITTLESDRTKLASSLSTQVQYQEIIKNAITLADRRADLYQ